MQTYTGRVESGQFLPFDGVTIPDCSVAVLVVEGIPQDRSMRQAEAMRRFRDEIKNIDEPTQDFERVKFKEIEI